MANHENKEGVSDGEHFGGSSIYNRVSRMLTEELLSMSSSSQVPMKTADDLRFVATVLAGELLFAFEVTERHR